MIIKLLHKLHGLPLGSFCHVMFDLCFLVPIHLYFTESSVAIKHLNKDVF